MITFTEICSLRGDIIYYLIEHDFIKFQTLTKEERSYIARPYITSSLSKQKQYEIHNSLYELDGVLPYSLKEDSSPRSIEVDMVIYQDRKYVDLFCERYGLDFTDSSKDCIILEMFKKTDVFIYCFFKYFDNYISLDRLEEIYPLEENVRAYLRLYCQNNIIMPSEKVKKLNLIALSLKLKGDKLSKRYIKYLEMVSNNVQK
jgi:hypothetical protein